METGSTLPDPWREWVNDSLREWESQGLLRKPRTLQPTSHATKAQISRKDLQEWIDDIAVGAAQFPPRTQTPGADCAASSSGRDAIDLTLFSTNDYLGLSTHSIVRSAAASAAAAYGSGPRSSTIVAGYTAAHRELETELATLKGTEDCILFPTGFAANCAAVSACMAGGDCVVFSDELNHASIIDGARLGSRSGAAVKIYKHNDMAHLEQLLQDEAPSGRRTMVVTDSLFSMDGDFADLRGLAALRKKFGFLLAVDEAHATLVCGDRGAGAADMMGVGDQVDLHVGTLSKAVGSIGGFVATSRGLKSWLANRGRAYVYSTALPLPAVAAAQAALRVSTDEPWRRRHVWDLVRRVGERLGVEATSPIVPVVIGSEGPTVGMSACLLGRGFHVPAIRPPTVPRGTSRLRISLSASHSTEEVEEMLSECSELDYTASCLDVKEWVASTP